MELKELSEKWLQFKEIEREAADNRRKCEDEMRRRLKIADDEEGTVKQVLDGYVVKATCRINRKIDPQQFLMLANDAKIDVADFTKWKCELVMSSWKKQPQYIQQALSHAITTEPGRATFSVEEIKE